MQALPKKVSHKNRLPKNSKRPCSVSLRTQQVLLILDTRHSLSHKPIILLMVRTASTELHSMFRKMIKAIFMALCLTLKDMLLRSIDSLIGSQLVTKGIHRMQQDLKISTRHQIVTLIISILEIFLSINIQKEIWDRPYSLSTGIPMTMTTLVSSMTKPWRTWQLLASKWTNLPEELTMEIFTRIW